MYIRGVENKVKEGKVDDMESLESIIKDTAEKILKSKYRRKKCKATKVEEPPRINKTIRNEIKKRKKLNRETRNTQNIDEKARKKTLYNIQKK